MASAALASASSKLSPADDTAGKSGTVTPMPDLPSST